MDYLLVNCGMSVTIQIVISDRAANIARILQAQSRIHGGDYNLSHFYAQLLEAGASEAESRDAVKPFLKNAANSRADGPCKEWTERAIKEDVARLERDIFDANATPESHYIHVDSDGFRSIRRSGE